MSVEKLRQLQQMGAIWTSGQADCFVWGYPLVNIQKAIENSPFVVELPKTNGDFP